MNSLEENEQSLCRKYHKTLVTNTFSFLLDSSKRSLSHLLKIQLRYVIMRSHII